MKTPTQHYSSNSPPWLRKYAQISSAKTSRLHRVTASALLAFAALSIVLPAFSQDAAAKRIDEALHQIDRYDQRYRAVIALDPTAKEQARARDRERRAPGPLQGLPVLLKDNIDVAGMVTTAGSLALAANLSSTDAPLVQQLRGAGAVILGKTNLSEWANFRSEFSSSGWSAAGGQARNAVDPSRSPCGSSSGSAVAVALGYVDITIGTETSGSIVCPASVNGVVGLKPTQGLVAGDGIVPLARTQDTAGPITYTVEQAATTLAVILDPTDSKTRDIRLGLLDLRVSATTLEGLRIGIDARTLEYDPRRDRELAKVIATLEGRGAVVVPGLKLQPYEGYSQDSYDVLLWEFSRDLRAYFSKLSNGASGLDLNKLIEFNEKHAEQELLRFDQSIFLKAQGMTDDAAEYARKRAKTRRAMREDGLDKLFDDHSLDVMLGITTGPAWKIDWTNGDAFFGPSMAGSAAVAGNPHITLPLAEVDGLPLGISLVGKRFEDHRLAAVAKLLSDSHGTIDWRARVKAQLTDSDQKPAPE
ncbi:MAG: amidase family protein [Pseudomonadota bacterium]